MQADIAAGDLAFAVDVLVTWIGAVALGGSAWVLGRREARSTLERRAQFLMGVLALMLFIRGFAWLRPQSVVLAFLVFVPISLLPIAMTVFVEGLLRRHAPRWMKWLASSATVFVFAANFVRLTGASERTKAVAGFAMLGMLLLSIAALAFVLARADRSSISRSEHALIRVCMVVAVLTLPLTVTDFRYALPWSAGVRMGTLGVLILCYSILRRPQQNDRLATWFRDLGRLVIRALLVCVLLAIALQTLRPALLVPLSVLAIALVFAIAVWDRLRDVSATNGENELLEWLARAPPVSREAFVGELKGLRLTADAVVVDDRALDGYDHAAIARAFPSGSVIQSLARLRALRDGEGEARTARGADELTDLLEKRGATHVGLLSSAPLHLLLVMVPDLMGRDVELALSAVVRRWPRADQMTNVATY